MVDCSSCGIEGATTVDAAAMGARRSRGEE